MHEFPEVFVFDRSEDEHEAGQELARQLEIMGVEAPFILASQHGEVLARSLEGPRPPQRPVPKADQDWAATLGATAHRVGADAVVAIGGGRCLDIAKLAAARAGVAVISVPTQLSHDGICSPVAVVPDDSGKPESIGAITPRAVFISLPTLIGAPEASVAAGLGDLLANPLALRDWQLAAERGVEMTDERAWDLSAQSYELIEPHLERHPSEVCKDPHFLRRLADALVYSGMAMICAGSSRPASGGEHEVSHAIDEIYGGRALHGAQVAFGCIVSMALYDEDAPAFRARLRALGLPQHPADLGLGAQQTTEILLEAPNTRPGRFTILEHADLDAERARQLVERLWPD